MDAGQPVYILVCIPWYTRGFEITEPRIHCLCPVIIAGAIAELSLQNSLTMRNYLLTKNSYSLFFKLTSSITNDIESITFMVRDTWAVHLLSQ